MIYANAIRKALLDGTSLLASHFWAFYLIAIVISAQITVEEHVNNNALSH